MLDTQSINRASSHNLSKRLSQKHLPHKSPRRIRAGGVSQDATSVSHASIATVVSTVRNRFLNSEESTDPPALVGRQPGDGARSNDGLPTRVRHQ